jgi:ubiquinone/menaquinone biosynthesis C-methylase UbiE
MSRNQDVYGLPEIATVYARQSELLPVEQTILHLLLPELQTARMLDLGVGGGRTTLHFARCVREYVGVDYSASMIRECQRRFATDSGRISFEVCDARSLGIFANESFDFILFSMNGIDYGDQAGRLAILKEVRRVGKPGGWFCFSTHNLNYCAQLFELNKILSWNPKFAKRTAKGLALRFFYNWRVRVADLERSPYAIINDGSHSRQLLTYYIRPEEQLNQLSGGFRDVRVFSSAAGSEILGQDELRSIQDPWLYYLCRVGAQF